MKTIRLFSIAAVLLTVAWGCNQETPETKKPDAVKVEVAPVKAITSSFPIRSSGNLASKTEAKLSFKTGGIIRDIYADEGQSVNKGLLLAALDLSEIEAQVKQARLAFEKAQRDLRRVENLYNDSVATLENFQDATTALEMAESNLHIAEFNLRHSKIVAPSDGKILRKLASENELVSSGMPVFLFAPTREPMVVRVNLTDKDIVNVNLGDSATVNFDAYPGETFPAGVTEIANAADPYTGTYTVEVELEPTEKRLISGFIARVHIIPDVRASLMRIPVESLVDGLGRNGYVFVAEGNKAARKKIKIARVDDRSLIVESGLEPGDSVITTGAQYVRDGEEIEIVENLIK